MMENKSIEDEKRMAVLEEQLKEARNQAEDADHKYDEVAKKLLQCETDLERAEERAETGETKIEIVRGSADVAVANKPWVAGGTESASVFLKLSTCFANIAHFTFSTFVFLSPGALFHHTPCQCLTSYLHLLQYSWL